LKRYQECKEDHNKKCAENARIRRQRRKSPASSPLPEKDVDEVEANIEERERLEMPQFGEAFFRYYTLGLSSAGIIDLLCDHQRRVEDLLKIDILDEKGQPLPNLALPHYPTDHGNKWIRLNLFALDNEDFFPARCVRTLMIWQELCQKKKSVTDLNDE